MNHNSEPIDVSAQSPSLGNPLNSITAVRQRPDFAARLHQPADGPLCSPVYCINQYEYNYICVWKLLVQSYCTYKTLIKQQLDEGANILLLRDNFSLVSENV